MAYQLTMGASVTLQTGIFWQKSLEGQCYRSSWTSILENITGLATAMLLLAQGSHGKKVYDLLTRFLSLFALLFSTLDFMRASK